MTGIDKARYPGEWRYSGYSFRKSGKLRLGLIVRWQPR